MRREQWGLALDKKMTLEFHVPCCSYTDQTLSPRPRWGTSCWKSSQRNGTWTPISNANQTPAPPPGRGGNPMARLFWCLPPPQVWTAGVWDQSAPTARSGRQESPPSLSTGPWKNSEASSSQFLLKEVLVVELGIFSPLFYLKNWTPLKKVLCINQKNFI